MGSGVGPIVIHLCLGAASSSMPTAVLIDKRVEAFVAV